MQIKSRAELIGWVFLKVTEAVKGQNHERAG